MQYGSVCSGIEAASVAWKSLGWKPVWFSEIEKFPNRVLQYHYPTIPNYGDITKLYENEKVLTTKVDLLVGGTPCQGFSRAGREEGIRDHRSNLTFEYLKLISILRPTWFVWENVPRVLTIDDGETFKEIITKIQEYGYGATWRVLDSRYFGIPQTRRRLYLVGHISGDYRYPASVLFDSPNVSEVFDSCQRKQADSKTRLLQIGNRKTGTKLGGIRWRPMQYTGDLCGTLTAMEDQFVLEDGRVRSFSTNECERIQGFPDNYTCIPNSTRQQRHKVLGNSMAVPVMKWIGKGIQHIEDNSSAYLKTFSENTVIDTNVGESDNSLYRKFFE
jgi:DNA (cytosine-5)-methyltransferase 1